MTQRFVPRAVGGFAKIPFEKQGRPLDKYLMNVLTSLLLAVVVFSFQISAAEVPVRSARTLRDQFDSYTELLKKEILFNKEKDKKKRFSLLNQAMEQMKLLREEAGTSDRPDAAHMDQVIASLNALPSKKKFKRKNCDEYQANLEMQGATDTLANDFINSLCE